MTNEEAKAIIEANAVPVFPLQIVYQDWLTAMAMALEALEKQIPKKPNKYDIDYSGNPLFRCPVCGDSWNSNEFGDGIEHCWTCGQAIDWSEA